MAQSLEQFPNLIFAPEVLDTLNNDKSLTASAKSKILGLMQRLDSYEPQQREMLGSGYQSLQKGWHVLKAKKRSDAWRLMFRRVPGSTKYGLVYLYRKTDQEIPDQAWKSSKRIAKREGWI